MRTTVVLFETYWQQSPDQIALQILEQKKSPFEILVMTRARPTDFGETFLSSSPSIRFFELPSNWIALFLLAIKEASGELVLFVPSHIHIDPSFLQDGLRYFRRAQGVSHSAVGLRLRGATVGSFWNSVLINVNNMLKRERPPKLQALAPFADFSLSCLFVKGSEFKEASVRDCVGVLAKKMKEQSIAIGDVEMSSSFVQVRSYLEVMKLVLGQARADAWARKMQFRPAFRYVSYCLFLIASLGLVFVDWRLGVSLALFVFSWGAAVVIWRSANRKGTLLTLAIFELSLFFIYLVYIVLGASAAFLSSGQSRKA